MFELISKGHAGVPHADAAPMAVSWTIHLIVLTTVVLVPMLYATARLPEVPRTTVFVANAVTPPPPPPPPPARLAGRPSEPPTAPTTGQFAAPIEAPSSVAPEPASSGVTDGASGGVEGGVPGGVLGGVVGGLTTNAPPPPPPPPPPVDQPGAPIRIGGEVRPPALLKRVNPEFPPIARDARVEGVVMLEATVDRTGHVEDVRVLRSIPLLDGAAKAAVRQWQYSPLMLNGRAERFILTVILTFTIPR